MKTHHVNVEYLQSRLKRQYHTLDYPLLPTTKRQPPEREQQRLRQL